jgi:two-component system cell cycle response regulator CpdR
MAGYNGRMNARRVLIADDEPDIREALGRFLERRGFEVVAVADGQEAAGRIKEEVFDLFFLDCDMPELTGIELVGLARARNPEARILMISGFPSINDKMLRTLGGDRFIHKPLQLAAIEKILQEEGMA